MTTDTVRNPALHEPSGYIPAESRWENHVCVTFGTFPTHEQFEAAFNTVCADSDYRFAFGNDPYVGTCKLTCSELWDVLHRVWGRSLVLTDERAESWVSDTLCILGWEWV